MSFIYVSQLESALSAWWDTYRIFEKIQTGLERFTVYKDHDSAGMKK
jgi:hypothetical protein